MLYGEAKLAPPATTKKKGRDVREVEAGVGKASTGTWEKATAWQVEDLPGI
jgi:hypothetical protein